MVEATHTDEHALLIDQNAVVLDFGVDHSFCYRPFNPAYGTSRSLQ